MKQVNFLCELCGTVKGAANHWWMVRVDKVRGCAPRLTIEAWDDMVAGEGKRQHVCGEEHLWKLLSPMLNNELLNAQIGRNREKQHDD